MSKDAFPISLKVPDNEDCSLLEMIELLCKIDDRKRHAWIIRQLKLAAKQRANELPEDLKQQAIQF